MDPSAGNTLRGCRLGTEQLIEAQRGMAIELLIVPLIAFEILIAIRWPGGR